VVTDGPFAGATRPAVCLDLDGTVYPGSAFVRALILVPWYLDVDGAGAAHLRDAVAAVARHRAGRRGERRFRRLSGAVDVVRRRASSRASLAVARGLLAVAPGHRSGGADGPGAAAAARPHDGRIDYDEMRASILDAYGAFLAGREPATVRAGVRRLVARDLSVAPAWGRVCARLCRAGTTTYLVTDAPAHLARPYAEKIGLDPANVRGTRFTRGPNGRYDGGYHPVAKDEAVAEVRKTGDHDAVVAAGDSATDLAMLSAADRFLAVGHETDLRRALADRAGDAVDAGRLLADRGSIDPGGITDGSVPRDGTADGARIVRVATDDPGETVEAVLDRWGLLAPAAR
jgi:phosphoserine phosphatase